MNTNDIRNTDYDDLRERALALRSQAISEMFGAAAAWLASLPARIRGRAETQATAANPCTADC